MGGCLLLGGAGQTRSLAHNGTHLEGDWPARRIAPCPPVSLCNLVWSSRDLVGREENVTEHFSASPENASTISASFVWRAYGYDLRHGGQSSTLSALRHWSVISRMGRRNDFPYREKEREHAMPPSSEQKPSLKNVPGCREPAGVSPSSTHSIRVGVSLREISPTYGTFGQ